jgi:hypothetical protein
MKNSKLVSGTNFLRVIVILPIIGLLAFTGCANMGGMATRGTARNQAAAYLEQRQEKTLNVVDQDPDPTYEWFY